MATTSRIRTTLCSPLVRLKARSRSPRPRHRPRVTPPYRVPPPPRPRAARQGIAAPRLRKCIFGRRSAQAKNRRRRRQRATSKFFYLFYLFYLIFFLFIFFNNNVSPLLLSVPSPLKLSPLLCSPRKPPSLKLAFCFRHRDLSNAGTYVRAPRGSSRHSEYRALEAGQVSMTLSLAILLAACRILREPVTARDVQYWAGGGQIAFMSIVRLNNPRELPLFSASMCIL
jgi:hypothetical protein